MGAELNIFSAGAHKIASHKAAVASWMAGEAVIPITLEIQPSEQCNHNCPSCQAQYSIGRRDARRRARRGEFLDLKLLDSVWDAPPAGIVLSGNTGDPLLHPEIEALLETLQNRSVSLVVITNGQAITPKLADQLVRSCTGVRISLDAWDADSFRITHGVRAEAWYEVLQGITYLVEAREKIGSDADKCLLGVGYLTRENSRRGMVGATLLARALDVDYIQFRPFHYDRTPVTAELEECRTVAAPPRFRVMASDQKYSRFGAPERAYSRCGAAWFYTVLDAQGDLYICCHHVGQPSACVGSLRVTTWAEFAASETRRSVLSKFSTASCVPLCRLNTENEFLYSMEGERIPSPALSPEIKSHSVFV